MLSGVVKGFNSHRGQKPGKTAEHGCWHLTPTICVLTARGPRLWDGGGCGWQRIPPKTPRVLLLEEAADFCTGLPGFVALFFGSRAPISGGSSVICNPKLGKQILLSFLEMFYLWDNPNLNLTGVWSCTFGGRGQDGGLCPRKGTGTFR